MNETEIAHLTFLYNFYFLDVSVGRVLMIERLYEKNFKVYMRSEVRAFDVTENQTKFGDLEFLLKLLLH
jgi:hypothetical protein